MTKILFYNLIITIGNEDLSSDVKKIRVTKTNYKSLGEIQISCVLYLSLIKYLYDQLYKIIYD